MIFLEVSSGYVTGTLTNMDPEIGLSMLIAPSLGSEVVFALAWCHH